MTMSEAVSTGGVGVDRGDPDGVPDAVPEVARNLACGAWLPPGRTLGADLGDGKPGATFGTAC